MSKDIMKDQALNRVKISGKLLDVTFRAGTTSDGREYESANITVRVTQTYGGRTETSEIPVSLFAAKYTQAHKLNPGYEQLRELHKFKTAQNVGIDEADTVLISTGSLRENNYVTKAGQLVNTWQISTPFISAGSTADVASFTTDIFIMDMRSETTRDEEPTGRLIIRGGIVQYNGNLDVIEFIVENPDAVDYIERNWQINTTVNVRGRIRITAAEEKVSGEDSSWGEEIPAITTRVHRELIITKGDDNPKDEEFAYEPTDIKKAFNARKARIEQLQINAKNGITKAKPKTTISGSVLGWEE